MRIAERTKPFCDCRVNRSGLASDTMSHLDRFVEPGVECGTHSRYARRVRARDVVLFESIR